MSDQLDMDFSGSGGPHDPDDPEWLVSPSSPFERAFAIFHRRNPHVYAELERLALKLWYTRHPVRIGVRMLWETTRYNVAIRTESTDGFKMNDHHCPFYARLLTHRHSFLSDVIELRARREWMASTE